METLRITVNIARKAPAALGAGVLSALLFVTGCGDAPPPPETAAVERGVFENVLEEVGVVEAVRTVPITAPFSGTLIELSQSGTRVQEGDLIYAIEAEEEINELREEVNELQTVQQELEATIESLMIAMRENILDSDLAQAQLDYNRAQLADTSNQLAETEVLLSQSIVPQDDLRRALFRAETRQLSTLDRDLSRMSQVTTQQTTERTGRSDVERAILQGEEAMRDIVDQQERVRQSRGQAPVSGIFVRSRSWSWRQQKMVEPRPGESVRRNEELGTIPDMESLIVRTQIPESYLTRLEEGGPAEVRIETIGGQAIPARISLISKVAIEREASPGGTLMQSEGFSGQKVFETEVVLDSLPENIKPGVTAQIRFVLDRQRDVLTVPIEAVKLDGEKPRVLVYDPSTRRTEERVVELGATNSRRAVITSGLRSGEQVVTSPSAVVAESRSSGRGTG